MGRTQILILHMSEHKLGYGSARGLRSRNWNEHQIMKQNLQGCYTMEVRLGYWFPNRSLDDHQVCHQNDHACFFHKNKRTHWVFTRMFFGQFRNKYDIFWAQKKINCHFKAVKQNFLECKGTLWHIYTNGTKTYQNYSK